MPGKFRESFEAMVGALRAHPKIRVIDAVIRPPASGAAIKDAEKALGRPLPDDVLEFYLAHDGIYLSWGLEGRDYGNAIEPFGFPDYGTPPGVVNLLPIAEVFSKRWVDDYTVNFTSDDHKVIFGVDQDEDEDDRVRAVVIDFFSKFHHADLVFGPKDQPAYALIADDHGAELMESNLSSFTTYLDVVLASWATERMPFYKVERYLHPKKIRGAKKARKTLDEIVEEAVKDAEYE